MNKTNNAQNNQIFFWNIQKNDEKVDEGKKNSNILKYQNKINQWRQQNL